ncbi:hypothetical protein [uncultured Holdemanella sp.]|uniref:hypothetical protein n=1 Tax=uncultured Holdemanella sp. TaxID=1763549 RepID=UPI0025FEED52|nr:hypothetical protein [uncultured Holdemanella sp.]
MIIELSVKNCFVFSLDPTNKTTAIYGPNNADKTCLIKCIQAMKEILLNQRIEIKSNLFSNDSVVSWVLHLNMRKIYYHFVYCFGR